MLTNTKNLKSIADLALLAGLLFAALQPLLAIADDYYISPTGDDANPGTLELPFQTIQRGADVALDGDNVYIMAGTYVENVEIANSGSDYDHMISFYAYGNGEVIVDAVVGIGMMTLPEADFIRIDGLTFINGLQSANNGAGIKARGNYGIFTHNVFHHNKHGIMLSGSFPDSVWIGGNNHHNEVAYNLSYLNEISGIWLKHTDQARVHHNIVFGNSTQNDFKGAITFYCGDGNEIYNNTIYNNEGSGIDAYAGTTPQPTPNSRVWNNLVAVHAPYNYAFKVDDLVALDPSNQYHHNLWFSLDAAPLFAWGYNNFFIGGRTLTFSQYVSTASQINPINGEGDFVSDPLLVNPSGGDYGLQWGSPAIDAGPTDSATYDSDGTRADLGALFFDQSGSGEIAVTATPLNPPIVIPANGGSFRFQIILTNISAAPAIFDGWTDVTLPIGGHYGPMLPPRQITLIPGASLTRQLTQSIPASAPAGEYTLNVYAGDFSPVSFFGTDRFTFQKLGIASASLSEPNWAVSGSLESPDAQRPNSQPSVLRLCGASPNPFNPRTTISYQLSANSRVNLRILDTAGRFIQTLVNGWQQAGTHEIGFDGSGLSSGVYLYRLEVGGIVASGKMLLMK